ncbi:hypothetical protein [Vagococcus xieshaowenii]|uniref:DNA translocase FtsK 4TM region domain-containing protein n=1 Tax=Vagococcus xieshaowenii TaxID=2562451 RepID=A0AAJ5JLS8_9ENTE|nr:hypothetical protein [Vagococcus xieshaowenii]QCA28840.1 hypothetical protein E4Z98_05715 [Vagococcus xieshaowenii]TFZ43453.1 hypothetical protein E4031_00160 [Vagococcus xieshaowenii]
MSNKKKNTLYIGIGILYVLFGILSFFSIGFVGRLMTNVLRFFVGEAYGVLAVISILYGLLLMLLKKELHFKKKSLFWGAFCLLLAIICWQQLHIPGAKENSYILSDVFNGLYRDIQLNQVTYDSGGGLLGAFINQCVNWLKLGIIMPFSVIIFTLLGGLLIFKKK